MTWPKEMNIVKGHIIFVHQCSIGEFQRDYERIVHSKAFRRMVDKAQVFSASKGDYYRTRMTHTQAVSELLVE